MDVQQIRTKCAKAFTSPGDASVFERYRRLAPTTTQLWVDEICQLIPSSDRTIRILDAGCGLGRFTIALSGLACGREISIIAVDHSANMCNALTQTAARFHISNIHVVQTNICTFESSEQFDVIFVSELLQLVPDTGQLLTRLVTLLAKNGLIVVRTPSHEQLRHHPWLGCFPKALALDLERTPDVPSLTHILEKLNMNIVQLRVLEEHDGEEAVDYAAAVEAGAFSVLQLLTPAERQNGIDCLRSRKALLGGGPPGRLMTLLAAQRSL